MHTITLAITVFAESEPLAERFILAVADYVERLKEEGAFRDKLGAVVAGKGQAEITAPGKDGGHG